MGLINLFKTIYSYIIIIAQWCGFSPFHLNLMSQPMGRIIVDSYSPYKQVIICVVSFPRHLNISVQKERYHTLNWVFQFSMEGEGMKRMALILIAMIQGSWFSVQISGIVHLGSNSIHAHFLNGLPNAKRLYSKNFSVLLVRPARSQGKFCICLG